VRPARARRVRQEQRRRERKARDAGRELRKGDLRDDGHAEPGTRQLLPADQPHGSFQAAQPAIRHSRYQVCNLATPKPTVEFRAFSGSLDEKKIVGWIMLSVGMVERALEGEARATNWTAKPVSPTSPIKRGGEGQTALTRLFYQLGWIKGRQSHTFGNVAGADAAELKTVKRSMMKMARKYDATPA
jgi:hypothetical protein